MALEGLGPPRVGVAEVEVYVLRVHRHREDVVAGAGEHREGLCGLVVEQGVPPKQVGRHLRGRIVHAVGVVGGEHQVGPHEAKDLARDGLGEAAALHFHVDRQPVGRLGRRREEAEGHVLPGRPNAVLGDAHQGGEGAHRLLRPARGGLHAEEARLARRAVRAHVLAAAEGARAGADGPRARGRRRARGLERREGGDRQAERLEGRAGAGRVRGVHPRRVVQADRGVVHVEVLGLLPVEQGDPGAVALAQHSGQALPEALQLLLRGDHVQREVELVGRGDERAAVSGGGQGAGQAREALRDGVGDDERGVHETEVHLEDGGHRQGPRGRKVAKVLPGKHAGRALVHRALDHGKVGPVVLQPQPHLEVGAGCRGPDLDGGVGVFALEDGQREVDRHGRVRREVRVLGAGHHAQGAVEARHAGRRRHGAAPGVAVAGGAVAAAPVLGAVPGARFRAVRGRAERRGGADLGQERVHEVQHVVGAAQG